VIRRANAPAKKDGVVMKNVRWLLLALSLSTSMACGGDGGDDGSGGDGDGDGDAEVDSALVLEQLGEYCLFTDPLGGTPNAGSAAYHADDCASGVCVSAGGDDAYCSAKCDDDWKQIDCPGGYSCKGPTGFKTCQEE
jgi:hypothetical protein